MPGGGTLQIRCRQNGAQSGRDGIAVEFIDTGVGIPENQLDKIFDPFFTTRQEGESSGLGLSISYWSSRTTAAALRSRAAVGERFDVPGRAAGGSNEADQRAGDCLKGKIQGLK